MEEHTCTNRLTQWWRWFDGFFLANRPFLFCFQLNNNNLCSNHVCAFFSKIQIFRVCTIAALLKILCRCEEMFARLLKDGGWDVAIIFHSVFWCFSTNCEQPVRLPRLLRGIKITCNIFAIFLHNEYYSNFLIFGFQIKIGAPHIPDHEWCCFGFGAVFATSIIFVSARFPNIFTPSKNILECFSKFKHSKCIQYIWPMMSELRSFQFKILSPRFHVHIAWAKNCQRQTLSLVSKLAALPSGPGCSFGVK